MTHDRRIHIGINLSPQSVDWPTLEAAWARAGEHDVLESVWSNDHLTNLATDRGGPSWEAVTAMAALAHHVPGKTLGHGVLSNTFRHPAVLAKQATVLDHVTGGRFVLGLGAGWHEGEHAQMGIPLPPPGERLGQLEAAVRVLHALFSDAAAGTPGVTLDDPVFPLRDATNEPPPLTPGGPPLWLGVQRPRGIRLAARYAQGWILPSVVPGVAVDLDYFVDRRAAFIGALETADRDPGAFAFATKIPVGTTRQDRADALASARAYVAAGATHVLLLMAPALGAPGVDDLVREVALPLREAVG